MHNSGCVAFKFCNTPIILYLDIIEQVFYNGNGKGMRK